MREAFGTVIAIILVIAAMFLNPMQNNANKEDQITQDFVYAEVADFVQQVQLNGYISQDQYNDFTKKLGDTNMLYTIEMTHSHDVVMPVFNEAGDAVVGTKVVRSTTYEDEILESVFNTDGIYYFEVGDQFTLTVKNKNRSLAQRLNALLNGSSTKYSVVATYGATIRNENY